jgi:SpoVK/Ycf46/Vps4 family AAA+-type ATPase
MLTQLLKRKELSESLLEYLPKLGISAQSVLKSIYRVRGGVPAWTSGHHPNQAEPESWATASVYHFIYEFDRLLAEAVRYELFRYLEVPFPRPTAPTETSEFAINFFDSELELDGEKESLKKILWQEFVEPLQSEAGQIADGHSFGKRTPRSAIFFGPPGTSKTELAKAIAEFLGWPQLSLDPSHFLRAGMDGIQAEANKIFRMLEETERVVVLFDEFDELVRERGTTSAEPFSRLLTTAMLPKLARLHKRGTLVFIIATNNVSDFDLAIRRRGRFDHVLQVMPPTYEAKLGNPPWKLKARFSELGVQDSADIRQMLGELTFDECEAFVADLAKASNAQAAIAALTNRWKNCTLQTPISREDAETWAKRCEAEAKLSH